MAVLLGYARLGGQPSKQGGIMPISPAAADRARRADQALDEERRRVGTDRNVRGADQQLEPSHGSPPRSQGSPNTSRGLKR